MPENVFQSETPESEEVAVPDEVVEKLKERGLDELAKGKAHADQFIEFLKEQAKELKTDHDKLLSENEKLKAEQVVKEARQAKPVVEEKVPDTSEKLSPDAIKGLVNEELQNVTKRNVADANIREVDGKIRELYKDKAVEFMKGKAEELGLTLEYLHDLAARSPNALYNILGVSAKSVGTPAPSVGTIKAAPTSSGVATPGTKKYYDGLKKANPRTFYTPEVQSKLFKDRERLGDNFYK